MIIISSKRLRALKKENDELKISLKKFNEKQGSIAQIDDMLRRIRIEIAELQNQKTGYINSLQKLKEIEMNARVEAEELKKEVGRLRELRSQEHKEIATMTDSLVSLKEFNGNGNGGAEPDIIFSKVDIEIKKAERKKAELQRETDDLQKKLKNLYQRIVELTEQEQILIADIDKKSKQLENIESFRLLDAKAELDKIEGKIRETSELERKSSTDFKERIKKLSEYEKELQNRISSRLRELEDINKGIEQSSETRFNSGDNKFLLGQNLQDTVLNLQNEALKINETISQLKITEGLKKELISKLNDDLSSKEIEFASLENDFTARSNQLKEVSIKNQELSEEIEFRHKQLSRITETLDNKCARLKEYEIKISELEKRTEELSDEITQLEILKSDSAAKVLKEKEIINSLEESSKKLTGDIRSLEVKKNQLRENNELFELRFAQMFEKYSKNIDEMNRKRNFLDQMLQKKEKDISERDETIIEKLSILDEANKVLLIRQKEIESFDDLLKVIKDQKELLIADLNSLDEKSIEKKIENQELKIESEVLQRKLVEFEKKLLELFNTADGKFKKSTERREKLDIEIKDYENRLKDLNKNIKDSMSELVELRAAIGSIKVEHEEHRIEINKLVEMRNKLQDDINKSRVIADKYNKIKERIKLEKEAIRKRRDENLSEKFGNHLIQHESSKEPDLTKIVKL